MCSLTSVKRTVLSFRRLLIQVLFPWERIIILWHQSWLTRRTIKKLRLISLLQHLKLRNFILNKVVFTFFYLYFSFYFGHHWCCVHIISLRKKFPYKIDGRLKFSWSKYFQQVHVWFQVRVSASKRFETHKKLATWAVHSSWKPNYKHIQGYY